MRANAVARPENVKVGRSQLPTRKSAMSEQGRASECPNELESLPRRATSPLPGPNASYRLRVRLTHKSDRIFAGLRRPVDIVSRMSVTAQLMRVVGPVVLDASFVCISQGSVVIHRSRTCMAFFFSAPLSMQLAIALHRTSQQAVLEVRYQAA